MAAPSRYNLHLIAVGRSQRYLVPTPEDCKRMARNVSQYGIRHDRGFTCRTHAKTRIMTVMRVR